MFFVLHWIHFSITSLLSVCGNTSWFHMGVCVEELSSHPSWFLPAGDSNFMSSLFPHIYLFDLYVIFTSISPRGFFFLSFFSFFFKYSAAAVWKCGFPQNASWSWINEMKWKTFQAFCLLLSLKPGWVSDWVVSTAVGQLENYDSKTHNTHYTQRKNWKWHIY